MLNAASRSIRQCCSPTCACCREAQRRPHWWACGCVWKGMRGRSLTCVWRPAAGTGSGYAFRWGHDARSAAAWRLTARSVALAPDKPRLNGAYAGQCTGDRRSTPWLSMRVARDGRARQPAHRSRPGAAAWLAWRPGSPSGGGLQLDPDARGRPHQPIDCTAKLVALRNVRRSEHRVERNKEMGDLRRHHLA